MTNTSIILEDDLDKDRWEKVRSTYFFGIFGLVLTAFTLRLFGVFWQALLFGALLALIIHPYYRWLLIKLQRPRSAAALACLSVTLTIVLPLLGVLAAIIGQLRELVYKAPEALPRLIDRITELLGHIPFVSGMLSDKSQWTKMVVGKTDLIVGRLSSATLDQAEFWMAASLHSIIVVMVLYFLLVDGNKLKLAIARLFGLGDDGLNQFLSSAERAGRSIFLGTFAAAAVQAILIGIGFYAAGIAGAVIAAAVTFVFAFVPLLGAWPTALAGVVIALAQSDIKAAVIIGVCGGIAGVADNFVRVLVVDDSEFAHPLLVFIAILAGIELLGPLGVVFAPLAVALVTQNFSSTQKLLRQLFGDIWFARQVRQHNDLKVEVVVPNGTDLGT